MKVYFPLVMNDLIHNDWFISIGSSIIMLIIVPAFAFLINNIRGRYGIFSGTYIAITGEPGRKDKIVELIQCRHIKNDIKGKIYGVAFIKYRGANEEIQPNKNVFRFKGNVQERLLVASYRPVAKGDLSAGTFTLNGNTAGTLFSGTWSGLEVGEVESSHCKWIKWKRKLNLKKDYDLIIDQVKMNSLGACTIMIENGTGKSRTIVLLKDLLS